MLFLLFWSKATCHTTRWLRSLLASRPGLLDSSTTSAGLSVSVSPGKYQGETLRLVKGSEQEEGSHNGEV